MDLTAVFADVTRIAREALAACGVLVEYTPVGGTPRPLTVVLYQDVRADLMLQDAQSTGGTVLMNPEDFPSGGPAQFDTLRVALDIFARTYTIESVHPIHAGNNLPMLLVRLRGN
jgi:hypothetical protein